MPRPDATKRGTPITQHRWTIAETVAYADAVVGNRGGKPRSGQLAELAPDSVGRNSSHTMYWRMQTVLGYPVASPAREDSITRMDRALAALFLEFDPRLQRRTA